ncbi:MAG: two-component sensor histidine kinase [Proteobacteria bacterium]|nr:two-component sensor histidine kinase [Pseudomonadota bacterium]MBU1714817.1 two-component sensor histidine kinase [Pseudomonadota bacterium]
MKKQEYTIRQRIITLYVVVFGFIAILASSYSWQIYSLENKLVALENFHDFFDNVLELRRYEKNLLFDVGSDNLKDILFYLGNIEEEANKLYPDIEQVVGKEKFANFRSNLASYKSIFEPGRSLVKLDAEAVRYHGKAMVDFSRDLLTLKQARIRKGLKLILYSFIGLTAGFFFFILLVFQLQAKSVIGRLAFVQQATKDLLQGKFMPIIDNAIKNDEVSNLILAFNKMGTEIEIKQEQLVQSRKLAAIGTFSSGIAHELNNPLNNISLSADALHVEYDELSAEEAKEIINDIILQTERASEVVKDLLDFCRDKTPTSSRLNIKNVIRATIKLIANQLRLNAIWLEDYIPDNLPLVVGDHQKLQQVFLNLFVNAIQVMPEGGLIHLDAKLEPEGYLRIDVNDTGIGIPPEKIEDIFDPFYTTKPVGQGTGLGLSIVYGIVKKHGGYIEVNSKINIGTTFSIFLPIKTENDPEEKP